MAFKSVKIVSDGLKTVVTDAETGSPIKCVSKAVISCVPNEPVTAELDILFVQVSQDVLHPKFIAAHPFDGKSRVVKSITFEDGETVEF
jgi:hypothetical protein